MPGILGDLLCELLCNRFVMCLSCSAYPHNDASFFSLSAEKPEGNAPSWLPIIL